LSLDQELLQQIKKKNFEEVETAWASRADRTPRNLDWFVEVARELRAVKQQPRVADLIGYLVDALGEAGHWEEAFDALREGLSLTPRSKELRAKVIECARSREAGRGDLDEVIAFFDVEGAEDAVRAFDEMREWLRFREGEGFWLFGRGLGKVAETNLALQKVKLRFEKATPLVVRRDEAKKLLTWIPGDHFLMRRLDDPAGVRKEARSDPGDMVRRLLECFGRPLNASEIRELMGGIVEGGAWSAWWARARSHPQVLPSKDVKGAFAWTGSSEEAEQQILEEFEAAPLEARMELARRFGKRAGTVQAAVLSGLAADLARVAPSGSSQALELALLLEELGGATESGALDVDAILRTPDAVERIAGVGDRRYRERLYQRMREVRPDDWAAVLQAAFFLESDLRLMSGLYEQLRDSGAEDAGSRLVAEAVSQPRKNPSAFVWVTRNVLARDELRDRANHALLSKVVEALDGDEFRDLRVHLKEAFDEGGLAFTVFEGCDLDGADNLLSLVDAASLEEHRKTAIRRVIFRRFPHIRKRVEQDHEVMWATAQSAEAKRSEFEHLVRVEIPQNTEAIRVAREFGDLSENFEYHAARQKHELLNTRAARLQKELRKVRLIDPDAVDPSVGAVGTRVSLEPTAGGAPRTLTILGPWDSDPDAGVFSYQSDFAKQVLGKQVGQPAVLDGVEYRITAIEVWRSSAGEPPSPSSPGGLPPVS